VTGETLARHHAPNRVTNLRRSACFGQAAAVLLSVLLTAPAGASGAGASSYAFANRCYAISSAATHRYVIANAKAGYRVAAKTRTAATPFYFKPTALGVYMLQDRTGQLVSVGSAGAVVPTATPGPNAAWALAPTGKRTFALRSNASGGWLTIGRSGAVATSPGPSSRDRLSFSERRGCLPFPEAQVDVAGAGRRARYPDGTVFGYADPHLHVTADFRAGGMVISGENYDPFGVTVALGVAHDVQVLGPNEIYDFTGNLLRSGTPAGMHDNHGWPTFVGWPTYNSYTHQQVYYRWLQRAWLGGLRLVTAQLVEDQSLCEIEPRRSHSCDETSTIELELIELQSLERYVDAQTGGPGKGWLRLVTSPAQARRVIAQGKLAMLVGVESSDPFGCTERFNIPKCTRADVDRGLALYHRLGISGLFIAHWLDNSFAGAALMGGAEGQFISAMEVQTTGLPFETAPCPEAGQGSSCNAMGLTPLGAYLVQRMMDYHMLIEMDHLSERARLQVLALAETRHYPVVSSHTNTGGFWTPSDLRRLYALGGFATARPTDAAALAKDILSFAPYLRQDRSLGVGLGTDTGGLNASPGPALAAKSNPLHYPFKAFGSNAIFYCEVTGTHRFNFNSQGVAQYGQYPDLLAYMRQQPGGLEASRILFHSAEAYLDMWQRAQTR
jgi:microsomal dipeptidase-like Zn-dependent dipeptidase